MKRYRYVTRLSKCWKIENGFLSIVQVSAEDILRIHLPRKKNKQTKSIDALFSWSDSLEMYLGTFPKLDSSPFPFFGDYGKPRLRWTREAFWNTQTQKKPPKFSFVSRGPIRWRHIWKKSVDHFLLRCPSWEIIGVPLRLVPARVPFRKIKNPLMKWNSVEN